MAWNDPLPTEIDVAKDHLRTMFMHSKRLGGCISYVQRKMGIGYNHACRIIEHLEDEGFLTRTDAQGQRELCGQ